LTATIERNIKIAVMLSNRDWLRTCHKRPFILPVIVIEVVKSKENVFSPALGEGFRIAII